MGRNRRAAPDGKWPSRLSHGADERAKNKMDRNNLRYGWKWTETDGDGRIAASPEGLRVSNRAPAWWSKAAPMTKGAEINGPTRRVGAPGRPCTAYRAARHAGPGGAGKGR